MYYSSITFVTKYSRIPKGKYALVNYNAAITTGAEPVVIPYEAFGTILESFHIQTEKLGLKVFACNIIPDHVHIFIGYNGIDISASVRQLKGYSSFLYNKQFGNAKIGGGQNSLRARGYSNTKITSVNHKKNTINYINRNHHKHSEKRGYSLVENYNRNVKKQLAQYNRLL